MMKAQLKNFALLFHNANEKGMLMFSAAILAVIFANLGLTAGVYKTFVYSESYTLGLAFNMHDFTNDFLMAIFFLLVGLEMKRELVNGNLATKKQRVLPVFAAIGGVVVPVIIYALFNIHDAAKVRGWAIPMATDIAFSLAVLSFIGKNLPVSLRVFLTALAIIDDMIAVIVISLFYSSGLTPYYLGMIGVIIIFITCVNLVRFNNMLTYGLLGFALWYAFMRSGVHPSIAGVVFGFCIPYDVSDNEKCVLRKMEKKLSGIVQYFILPIFAFVNSGVVFESSFATYTNTVILGIILGLFVGKQLGIFGVSYYLVRAGYATLPAQSNWKQFYGISIICGIGFTMSLFIGNLAYSEFPPYLNDMKLGVLVGSALSALTGWLYLRKR